MFRSLFYCFIFLLAFHGAFAQYVDEKVPEKMQNIEQSKIVYGGNALVAFGNPSILMFSPRLGYRLIDPLILGLGFTYLSYRENLRIGNQVSSLNLQAVGPGLFSMYFFSLPLVSEWGFKGFAALEYDYWYTSQRLGTTTSNSTFQQFLVGGGVMSTSGRLVSTVGIYYDLLYYTNKEIFASPISYRIGVLF
jgi:hypothetical protein